jgi:hypothetical protein
MECTKCHEIKEIPKGKRWCKDCKNNYEIERKKKNWSEERWEEERKKGREKYEQKKTTLLEPIEVDSTQTKQCSVCSEIKQLDEFHIAKTKGHIRAMCKMCSSQKRKEYYQNHREKTIEQTNNYKVEKMKRDPVFKLERMLRCRIYMALTSQTQKKQNRTWQYINCSSQFFKNWMEFQLYDGMTLDNYGAFWHVDHVKPCSSFDLSIPEQIEECFSWKNLRPYRADKNIQKSASIQLYDILLQELKVKCFLKQHG